MRHTQTLITHLLEVPPVHAPETAKAHAAYFKNQAQYWPRIDGSAQILFDAEADVARFIQCAAEQYEIPSSVFEHRQIDLR